MFSMISVLLKGALENTTHPSQSINGQTGYLVQAGCKQAKTNYQQSGDYFFFLLALEHAQPCLKGC